ncbi:MAG: CBS domain-containing protein [Gemmatimonadaceae bacterium]
MKARDIMTAHPSVVGPNDTVRHAAELMRDRHIGMLPVIDDLRGRHAVGVLTIRDIATRCVAAGHDAGCCVRDHMTRRSIVTVAADADIDEVIHKMQLAQLRRILVVGMDERLVGVIAHSDVATRGKPLAPEPAHELAGV